MEAAPKVVRPAKGTIVDRLTVAWYVGESVRKPDLLDSYWAVAAEHFPEALISRYGEWEPFAGRVSRSGYEGVDQARRGATQTKLFFTCTALPATEGHVITTQGVTRNARHSTMLSLELLAEPFKHETWRDRLRTLITRVAEAAHASYAKAEVTGGAVMSGSRMASTVAAATVQGGQEWSMDDGFLGLPQEPVWWSWFGPEYLPLVRGLLDRPANQWQVMATESGAVLSLSREPETLRTLRSRVLGIPVPSRWVPGSLRVTGRDGEFFGKLRPARTLPTQEGTSRPVSRIL